MFKPCYGASTSLVVRLEGFAVMLFPCVLFFQIHILQHDITKLRVDVIVNAANGRLQHGSGVAKAIADAAGSNMNRECRDLIRKQGNRRVGVGEERKEERLFRAYDEKRQEYSRIGWRGDNGYEIEIHSTSSSMPLNCLEVIWIINR